MPIKLVKSRDYTLIATEKNLLGTHEQCSAGGGKVKVFLSGLRNVQHFKQRVTEECSFEAVFASDSCHTANRVNNVMPALGLAFPSWLFELRRNRRS